MFQCPAPIINIPPAPPNHEWWKILLSALIGAIAGLIAEPIKAVIKRRIDARTVVRSIRDDLRSLLTIAIIMQEQNIDGSPFWNSGQIHAFNHYKKSKPDLFYEEESVQMLGYVCERINMYFNEVKNAKMQKPHALSLIIGTIEEGLSEPGYTDKIRQSLRKALSVKAQHTRTP